jgi:hypothetical protein
MALAMLPGRKITTDIIFFQMLKVKNILLYNMRWFDAPRQSLKNPLEKEE